MTELFQPYRFAGHSLNNRFVMAPMTRARRPDYVADAETALYYRQRATAGLIVSEGTPVSPEGQGYINVPGIWSAEQVKGWRLVTDAVHDEGGTIFAQLWHVGRMSHVSLQPGGAAPVSSTSQPARDPKSMAFVFLEDGTTGFAEPSVPRPLTTEEMARIAADFANAGRNAHAAGFDGVELHGANGYLFEQFLNPVLNDRTDRYGGSLENRARLLLETVDALIAAIGAHRVGIRLAPFNRQFDMPVYDDGGETYLFLAHELSQRQVAYVHLNDNWAAGHSVIGEAFLRRFRQAFDGTLILAGAMTFERAQRLVDEGLIDLPAFGQPFIANPDLVERLRQGAPLAQPDRATYYGGGSAGYTGYPALDAA
jgi:2,4-dienoyl-CoA reductase-like NADH-dependent reductase (Old Yellow Enzyme family)